MTYMSPSGLAGWDLQEECLWSAGGHLDAQDRAGAQLPSGYLTENYGKSQFLMGKSTISMENPL